MGRPRGQTWTPTPDTESLAIFFYLDDLQLRSLVVDIEQEHVGESAVTPRCMAPIAHQSSHISLWLLQRLVRNRHQRLLPTTHNSSPSLFLHHSPFTDPLQGQLSWSADLDSLIDSLTKRTPHTLAYLTRSEGRHNAFHRHRLKHERSKQ